MNKYTVVLNVKGLEKSYNSRKILDQIQFDLKYGERIGLVGYNGAGKTTLANLVLGKETPDKGWIEKKAQLKIGYLSQSIDYEVNDFQEALKIKEVYQLASELGLKKVYDWQEDRLANLSGGEKLKLALSSIWASNPDLLILDEPTNHLDYKGVNWLVSEIEKFPGAVFIISHDRHFLDQTVKRIFELQAGKLHHFNGNYTAYRQEKERQRANQHHQYEVQQRQIERMEAQMEQLKTWSDNAHRASTKEEGFKEYHRVKAKKVDNQVKSKRRRLEKELAKNKVEKPIEDAKVRFQFDGHGKRGKRIIEARNLGMSYDDRKLFQNSQFYINHGERIGLLGENGCGKTTLIKMIMGLVEGTTGELWSSKSLKIAYLSQDVSDLPAEKTALEAMGFTDKKSIFKARTMLANIGLTEQLIMKPIGTLSLGERTRVKLVDMLMKEYDVLILDEPTNHLDLPSREQLEKTLSEFTGTIITVSHDYYFLNKLCDIVLAFDNKQISRLEMTPEQYFNKGKQDGDDKQETLLVIETKIAAILGKLSTIDQKDSNYQRLDEEFQALVKQKNRLSQN
ncbi:ribosomal protection-like ABC-F family protein [Neobacillus niacini]|uniref:ribosomal protection-like ABC-F family protein n=1 Tax=Neobacillus niacini TaxID=86668 RepID=UPI0021CB14F8|nr:ABC-F type ribosomal protection protein [Neobacillus niacini]MCM3764632.1 ABC-F type ribosomal protection protein [Neobacillus niacini]